MVAQLIDHKHHLAMQTSGSDSSYGNRGIQLTPVQQKIQNASCNGIGDNDEKKSENMSDEHLTPFERRLRWMRSHGHQNRSSKRNLNEKPEGLSPIQRKVMNYIGGGAVRKDADAYDNEDQIYSPSKSVRSEPIQSSFKSPMTREYSSSSLFDSPESHPGRDERRRSPFRRLKASSSGKGEKIRKTPKREKSSSSKTDRTKTSTSRTDSTSPKGEDIRKTPKREKSSSSRTDRTKTSFSRTESASPHGRKKLTSSNRSESFRRTTKRDKLSSRISRSESFRKTPKREKSSSSSKGDVHRKTPKREKSSSSSKEEVTKKGPKREKSSRREKSREKSKEGTRRTPKRDKSSSSRSERDRKPLRRARSSSTSNEESRTRKPVRRAKSSSNKGETTEEPLAAAPFTAEPNPQQERSDVQQNTKPLFRSNPRTQNRPGMSMKFKPASTGDLFTLSCAKTKSGNGHYLLMKMKQGRRMSEADCGLSSLANEKFNFESENSPFSTKEIKTLQLKDAGSTCSADDNSFFQDANSAFGDFGISHRRRRKKEQKPPEDDISFGSSPFKNVTTKDQQRRASDNSLDLDAFFDQGFGNENGHRWRSRSKSQNDDQKGDETHPRQQQQQQQQQQTQPLSKNNECSITEGLVLHSSKDLATSSHDEGDSRRRKSNKCRSGGKVRNNRTQEEYTGFFLTSSPQDNIKHGYGITKFPDGRVFEGVYKQGKMVEGKMSYPAAPDGDTAIFQNADLCRSCGFAATYVGRFDEAGHRCGKGIYITESTTFLGEFFLDEQCGSGILIYHDDTDDIKFHGMAATGNMSKCRRFVGHWKGGYRHGYGREILADGTVHLEGLWEAGHHVGPVV